MSSLEQYWYQTEKQPPLWAKVLEPLFRSVTKLRRALYRSNNLSVYRAPVPVIIVGNINVGGSGKTPLVIWLVETLREAGYKPGVISRGYGGEAENYPLKVGAETPVSQSGDEPLLISRRTGVPLVVDPKRSRAAEYLLQNYKVDVIISDDGLQHYALARDIELVVVDGQRRFGNTRCLPAGPLREPLSRLHEVDFVINNGGEVNGEVSMRLQMGGVWQLSHPQNLRSVESFAEETHAVAGIGNPERFFQQLEQAGIHIQRHSFPDHHAYQATDLPKDGEVLMTEKDAVKCLSFAADNTWAVSVQAVLPEDFRESLLARVAEIAKD